MYTLKSAHTTKMPLLKSEPTQLRTGIETLTETNIPKNRPPDS